MTDTNSFRELCKLLVEDLALWLEYYHPDQLPEEYEASKNLIRLTYKKLQETKGECE